MTLLAEPPTLPADSRWLERVGDPVDLLPAWYKPHTVDPTTLRYSSPRVGLDLDGVFYDFAAALRHYLVAYCGFDPADLPEPTRWEFYLDWGLTLAEFIGLCNDAVDRGVMFTWGRVRPGAREAAFDLYEAGFELHVLTDRTFGAPGASKKATEGWLVNEVIPHHSLTITGDKTSVWTDYMIEDKVENYLALEAAGTQAYLLDQPWNQHLRDARRVFSLAEFAASVITDARDHQVFKKPRNLVSQVPAPTSAATVGTINTGTISAALIGGDSGVLNLERP